jgi:hypothetical protein
MSKSIIYYRRAYRKIAGTGYLSVRAGYCNVTFALFIYPYITEQMGRITQAVLSSYYLHRYH